MIEYICIEDEEELKDNIDYTIKWVNILPNL